MANGKVWLVSLGDAQYLAGIKTLLLTKTVVGDVTVALARREDHDGKR